jgi:hypothetical protein
MSDPALLERAAALYLQAGHRVAALACYREAGAHLRAADVALSLGRQAIAASEYAEAGMPVQAAWLLAVDDPARARAMITGTDLLSRLVLARCEPGPPLDALAAEVCDGLAAAAVRTAGEAPGVAEEWMISLAEQAHRADLVALVFAAAVRGRRIGAVARWQAWAKRVLHADLIIPDPS